MLCMTAGYVNFKNKNDKYVPATCKCKSTKIINDRCYDSCCYRNEDDECEGCYYDCFSGLVNADIENVTVNTYGIIVYTSDYWNKVNAYLNVNYPIGKMFHCYYTFHNDDVTISLGLYNPFPSFVAGLVFLSISGLFLLFWMIVECYTCSPYFCGNVYECCFNCCSQCKRRFNRARETQSENRERRVLIKYAQDPPSVNSFQRSDSQGAPSAPPEYVLNIN